MPKECPKHNVTAVEIKNTRKFSTETDKDTPTNASNNMKLFQIDLAQDQATLPFMALVGIDD